MDTLKVAWLIEGCTLLTTTLNYTAATWDLRSFLLIRKVRYPETPIIPKRPCPKCSAPTTLIPAHAAPISAPTHL